MAGQQHPFPSGFPSVQQSAMRTQFGGGQMVSGLMGPQQGSKYNIVQVLVTKSDLKANIRGI